MKSALTAAFVLTACVSFAQAPGPRADLVRTTLPLEGAPKAIPGPYKVMSEPALGSPGHVVFRPEDLGGFPGKDKLPVMAWGDGGCAINSARYSGFFTTIASHGDAESGCVEREPELQVVLEVLAHVGCVHAALDADGREMVT